MDGIARNVTATGFDAGQVARRARRRRSTRDDLRLVVVFADWRIDPAMLARALQQALPAPVVGCTTIGVISAKRTPPTRGARSASTAIGCASASASRPSCRSRRSHAAAMPFISAAAALGTTADRLESGRHVALTLVDGSCGHEEAFCIASAATAPQIRMVGGSAATEHGSSHRRAFVWANGEALADAGVVVLLDSKLPFEAVTSQHMVATADEDGRHRGSRPHDRRARRSARRRSGCASWSASSATSRARRQYSFARFVDGMPYVRSMTHIEGTRIHLACAVEVGHVLRLMRPGDLIGQTARDLAGGARRDSAASRSVVRILVHRPALGGAPRAGSSASSPTTYAAYPTIGFQSFGEQTGMLLVNHTLTGLAIGDARRERRAKQVRRAIASPSSSSSSRPRSARSKS